MPDPSAYPYDRWPRVSREEIAQLRSHARSGPLAALARGAARAGRWLGAQPSLTPATPLASAALTHAIDPIVAVALEDSRGARAVLVLDAPIASAIVDRALGGIGEGLDAAVGPLRELERGVLAYAFARWLAGAGSPFAVATVLSSAAGVVELLGSRPLLRSRSELQIGNARGRVAAWEARELHEQARGDTPAGDGARVPSWALELPIELAIRAATLQLTAAELAALGRGDVVVPHRCELELDGGAPRGSVRLESLDGACGFRAELEHGSLRIAQIELGLASGVHGYRYEHAAFQAAFSGSAPASECRGVYQAYMTRPSADVSPDQSRLGSRRPRASSANQVSSGQGVKENSVQDGERVLKKLGSTPVILSLELARFALPLGEVAGLGAGEVVRTGAAIGGRVTLRAGDRVVAIGELVDVEGEIGLRVLELPSDAQDPA